MRKCQHSTLLPHLQLTLYDTGRIMSMWPRVVGGIDRQIQPITEPRMTPQAQGLQPLDSSVIGQLMWEV